MTPEEEQQLAMGAIADPFSARWGDTPGPTSLRSGPGRLFEDYVAQAGDRPVPMGSLAAPFDERWGDLPSNRVLREERNPAQAMRQMQATQGFNQRLGDIAAERFGEAVDIAKTPGDVLQGRFSPPQADPKVYTEADVERYNRAGNQLERRAPLLGAKAMYASTAFPRELNSLGMGGGGKFTPPGTGAGFSQLQDAAAKASQDYTKSLLPPPKSFMDRIWDNYAKHMTPEEFLQSEPLWGGAQRMAEATPGMKEPAAFARIANNIFERMGLDRRLTPEAANQIMGEQRGASMLSDIFRKPPDAEAIRREPVVRGRSGRPIETAPLPIGTEQAILDAGYARATGPRPAGEPPPFMQAERRQGPVMGELARQSAPAIIRPRNITKYVDDPQRVAFPGVYKDPRALASEAAANVAPEHPALKSLFGVTRDDLYGISQQGTRQGNIEPQIFYPEKGRGSYAADAIMNKRNAQRMVDAMSEAEKYPQLTRGMDAWYVMDPAFRHMVKLVGREQAIKDYTRFNKIVPPFSAGSDVLTEINRGTAANMFATRGDYPSFVKYGGVKEANRGAGFPDELRDVKGHAYHGVQADPVARYLATGEHGYANDTVKIPLYSQASGVPETGFQTRLPVPDAHFARASGMADVRKSQNFADYMGGSEYRPYGPWYRENVAKPLGIEAVPAQGRMWGLYAPQTGVETAVGAPKLELLSQSIWERAKRLGIDPYKLRDDVLTGKEHAMWLMGLGGAGGMGALAKQGDYQ